MQKSGDLEPILNDTNRFGTVYSAVVSRQNAYGWEAFLKHSFNTFAPLVAASTAWNDTTDVITSAAHPLKNGQVVRATTTGGLPTGISGGTDYWVIYLTPNTFALAASLADCVAGTKVDFSTAGTGDHTLTKQTDVCTYVVESSPDGQNWVAHDGMTPVSMVGTTMLNKHFESASMFLRLKIQVDKGNLATITNWLVSKG